MGVKFDNVDDRLDIPAAASINNLGPMSISAWINPITGGGGGGASTDGNIVGKGTGDAGRWQYRFANASALTFFKDGTTDLNVRMSLGSITTGGTTWQNVIVTWTGTTDALEVKHYVNGVETGYALQTSGVSFATEALAMSIGARTSGANNFDGYIAELAIWNAVITTGDIAALSAGRVKGLPLRLSSANLVAYWPLDDVATGASGDAASFRDRAGTNTATGNDGTNNTGCTGTFGEPMAYLLQNDKNRGIARGVMQGGFC